VRGSLPAERPDQWSTRSNMLGKPLSSLFLRREENMLQFFE
jgi:hypothetical protein